MRHKKEVEFEGIMELTEAIDQVDSVLAGLRSGTIGLSHGDQTLNLKPASTVRLEVEGKQKEIDHINSKMALPIDQDILRMRIQKDLESKYRFDIDSKSMELDRLSEQYFETKRHLELTKTELENLKVEHEKVLGDIKRRNKEEIDELVSDNHALQRRIEDTYKDKEVTRGLRREIDDIKRRLCEAQQEALDLRKERDQLKIDKNELIIKNAKDVEEDHSGPRGLPV